MADTTKVKVALGQWLELSSPERAEQGLPGSQDEFAEHWKVSARSIVRWKEDPITVAAHDAAAAKRAGEADRPLVRNYRPRAPLNAVEPPMEANDQEDADALEEALSSADPAEAEFQELRALLAKQARKGGPALDTYMRYFGKSFMEAQRAQENSSFADLTDVELVDKILSMLGRKAVEAWLSSAGE